MSAGDRLNILDLLRINEQNVYRLAAAEDEVTRLRAEIRVADDLTHSVIAAREHAEKTLIRQRDEARAEVERLREENLRLRAVGGDPTAPPVISEGTIRLRRERDEARAEVERLRARIERARALCEQAFPERKQRVSLATIIAALDGES